MVRWVTMNCPRDTGVVPRMRRVPYCRYSAIGPEVRVMHVPVRSMHRARGTTMTEKSGPDPSMEELRILFMPRNIPAKRKGKMRTK